MPTGQRKTTRQPDSPDSQVCHAIPTPRQRLGKTFYDRATATVARELIGKALLHRVAGTWRGGWIVESEAYLDRRDPASHSSRGKTASNASMFGASGLLYVYPIHAKYCLNTVTQPAGEGAAVLIRAIEPIWDVESMKQLRGRTDPRQLTSGPAKLCQALAINRGDDGRCLLTDSHLGIYDLPTSPVRSIIACKRIGISRARHRNLRFLDPDSPCLSRRP